MIALTQEKREELIKAAKFIATGGKYSFTAQIARVALASLTAEPVGRVNLGDVSDNNEHPDAKVDCIHSQAGWGNFQDGFLLFAAPPVPEIRFPNRNEIPDWVWDDDDFCTWYEAETKRLNGLGD